MPLDLKIDAGYVDVDGVFIEILDCAGCVFAALHTKVKYQDLLNQAGKE